MSKNINAFYNELHKLSKDEILNNAKYIPDLRNDLICKHYIYLLDFTKNISKNSIIDLIGLIHMCYGWMPTMYDNSDVSIYEDNLLIKSIWENINIGSLDNVFLGNIKKISNNSIVGGSKLLHFCNPEMYAIYDSRVYSSILGKETSYNVNNIENFYSYTNRLRELKKDGSFILELRKNLRNKLNDISVYTDLRCLEICFFYNKING